MDMFNKTGAAKRVLGVMSGTSLDGIDYALVDFAEVNGHIHYNVIASQTYSYSKEWIKRLKEAENCSGERLLELHAAYGKLTGEWAHQFLIHFDTQAELIAMHGHTLFHQPEKGFTFQLGSGPAAAAASGLTVVYDFRSTDIAHRGQGAPLVPIGDKLLFPDAASCLNLGGFANISLESTGKRVAWDICAVNYVLNFLAQREGLAFDRDGTLARSGNLLPDLLERLNTLPKLLLPPPKSLSREWVEQEIFPLLSISYKTSDLLHTFVAHIVNQIAPVLNTVKSVLVTGGGAHNNYLIDQLRKHTSTSLELPDAQIINFKEAIIFALLGWLRLHHRTNALHTVTGAVRDSCCGSICLP